jgi:hypothetical protein
LAKKKKEDGGKEKAERAKKKGRVETYLQTWGALE